MNLALFDFDGTITAEETFVAMLKTFATIRFKKIEKLVVSGKLPLKEGVRRMVESIPSHRHPEILEQIRKKPLRRGFPEFIDFLHGRKVPFVVISGGLMDSVEARLASFSDRIYAVHAPEVDRSGSHFKLKSQIEGEHEILAKADIMSDYNFEEAVAIGDGLTDLNMSLAAATVFAREGLARDLKARGKSYHTWEDFFDIRDALLKLWQF